MSNPFRNDQETNTALTNVEGERAIQEVQAALVIAKRFPRNKADAMDRILAECAQPALAQESEYAFKRGGQRVDGPSIRLAEAIMRCWGNVEFGVRELSRENGMSVVQAYAWDTETNTRRVINFNVKHVRDKQGGPVRLSTERDIYEMVMNQGARRLRMCILSLVPGAVVEAALQACHETMKSTGGAEPEQIKKLIEGFAKLGVSAEMIRTRVGHELTSLNMAEIASLRKIYAAIKDGFGLPGDYFESDAKPPKPQSAPKTQKGTQKTDSAAPDEPGGRVAIKLHDDTTAFAPPDLVVALRKLSNLQLTRLLERGKTPPNKLDEQIEYCAANLDGVELETSLMALNWIKQRVGK